VGRRSMTGGVVGKGGQRIQYEFRLNGVRYRPSIKAIPTEANLRRAREHLKEIQQRIRLGTFSFIEDFPDFRDLNKVFHSSPYRTCSQVFDEYLAHCESRRAKNDLSFAILDWPLETWPQSLKRWNSRQKEVAERVETDLAQSIH
jgi:hypothetical protein